MSTTPHPAHPIRLYRMRLSGHCHRVELLLSLLALPYEPVDVDLMRGEHKAAAFLTLNPFGQVPVILDADVVLADSNAIMVYLEARYAPGQWMPRDAVAAALVQQWLSAAAGPLAYGPAAARVINLFKLAADPADAQARAVGLFTVMEHTLAASPFLVGRQPTLADVALYSYTATAPEGGVTLEPYPSVRRWLQRVEQLPGFVAMPRSAIGLAA